MKFYMFFSFYIGVSIKMIKYYINKGEDDLKKKKLLTRLATFMITLSMVAPSTFARGYVVKAEENQKTASQKYVEEMGKGWNLGNTFDGVDTDVNKEDLGETAWGNPVVTKELIKEIKDKGYDSIRMPMTAYRRFTEVDGKYIMNEAWLNRYKEVVDWAVEDNLYVMINLHHDSWLWLKYWDGNIESKEYKMFVDLWEEIADKFKDSSELVSFETINEPQFSDTKEDGTKIEVDAQTRLDILNKVAYDIIRNSGGNNDTRMIIIPTMNTNHEEKNSEPAYQFIKSLNDENVIATIHYYSEWVFSSNLGITSFDEALYDWSDTYTAREAAKGALDLVYNKFTKNGIGVVVGEWGLLGYDSGSEVNQSGEELKYYEYMDYLASERGISLMFWDNGSGVDRNDTENYSWKKPLVGNMLESGINGIRSSYATELNTNYISKELESDLEIKLTLNGNKFVGIDDLKEGTEYTYNAENESIILKKDFINNKFKSVSENKYGNIADLVIKFSNGANWHQYLVKNSTPVFEEATGTKAGITIPVQFNGTKIRRAVAYNEEGKKIGPNAEWWKYLQYNETYSANYENNTIEIKSNFLNYWSVSSINGEIKFVFELYDGQFVECILVKDGDKIVSKKSEVEIPEQPEEPVNPEEPVEPEQPEVDEDKNDDVVVDDSKDKEENSDETEIKGDSEDNSTDKKDETKLPNTGGVDSNALMALGTIILGSGTVLLRKKKNI